MSRPRESQPHPALVGAVRPEMAVVASAFDDAVDRITEQVSGQLRDEIEKLDDAGIAAAAAIAARPILLEAIDAAIAARVAQLAGQSVVHWAPVGQAAGVSSSGVRHAGRRRQSG